MVINVMLAVGSSHLRESLSVLLVASPNIHVQAAVATSDSLSETASQSSPNVLIVDRESSGVDEPEDLSRLLKQWPAFRVLVVSAEASNLSAVEWLRHGASGYVTSDVTGSQLIHAVQFIAAGNRYLHTHSLGHGVEQFTSLPVFEPLATIDA